MGLDPNAVLERDDVVLIPARIVSVVREGKAAGDVLAQVSYHNVYFRRDEIIRVYAPAYVTGDRVALRSNGVEGTILALSKHSAWVCFGGADAEPTTVSLSLLERAPVDRETVNALVRVMPEQDPADLAQGAFTVGIEAPPAA